MTFDCKFCTDHLQFSSPFTYLFDKFCNSCKLTAIQVSSFIRCSLKLLFIYPALCPFDRSLPHLRALPYHPLPRTLSTTCWLICLLVMQRQANGPNSHCAPVNQSVR